MDFESLGAHPGRSWANLVPKKGFQHCLESNPNNVQERVTPKTAKKLTNFETQNGFQRCQENEVGARANQGRGYENLSTKMICSPVPCRPMGLFLPHWQRAACWPIFGPLFLSFSTVCKGWDAAQFFVGLLGLRTPSPFAKDVMLPSLLSACLGLFSPSAKDGMPPISVDPLGLFPPLHMTESWQLAIFVGPFRPVPPWERMACCSVFRRPFGYLPPLLQMTCCILYPFGDPLGLFPSLQRVEC